MAKLYLAGAAEKSFQWPRGEVPRVFVGPEAPIRRVLFSFHYDVIEKRYRLSRDIEYYSNNDLDLFMDSGAFTAATKGITVEPERYAKWLAEHGDLFTVASSIDVIGKGEEAAQASYDTFQKLRAMGAHVQPVWHVREPDDWLKRYLDEGHEYVFIGGMVPETTSWLLKRLDNLFANVLTDAKGYPRAKYHGFGLTAYSLVKRYPWHSVDSTAWVLRAGYGMVVYPTDNGERYIDITVSTESPRRFQKSSWYVPNMAPPQREKLEAWMASCGFTLEELSTDGAARAVMNAVNYQRMEQFIPERFTRAVDMELFIDG